MTVAEFKATGLAKLSPEELVQLNLWLNRYALRIFEAASKPPSSSSATETSTQNVIESQMDGEFNGWDGETIFKLANGQIWQQSSYAYTYHYAYRPKVLIFRSGSLYKLKVDGVDD